MPKTGSRFRFSDRRLMAFAVETLLLFGLAYLLIRILFFIGFGASGSDFQIETSRSGPGSAQSSIAGGQLAQVDFTPLFADRRVASVAETASDIVPDTQLQLVLRGIRRGTDPGSGAALIQLASMQQVFVPVGEEITDGVELREVHADYVIISRRGIREALRIRETSERLDRREAPAALASSDPTEFSAAQIAAARGRPGERYSVGGMFQVEPRYVENSLVGIAFIAGNNSLLESVGLRMNDVLVAINGQPVTNPDQIQALFEGLRGNDTVQISVVRSGMSLTFSVDLP